MLDQMVVQYMYGVFFELVVVEQVYDDDDFWFVWFGQLCCQCFVDMVGGEILIFDVDGLLGGGDYVEVKCFYFSYVGVVWEFWYGLGQCYIYFVDVDCQVFWLGCGEGMGWGWWYGLVGGGQLVVMDDGVYFVGGVVIDGYYQVVERWVGFVVISLVFVVGGMGIGVLVLCCEIQVVNKGQCVVDDDNFLMM